MLLVQLKAQQTIGLESVNVQISPEASGRNGHGRFDIRFVPAVVNQSALSLPSGPTWALIHLECIMLCKPR